MWVQLAAICCSARSRCSSAGEALCRTSYCCSQLLQPASPRTAAASVKRLHHGKYHCQMSCPAQAWTEIGDCHKSCASAPPLAAFSIQDTDHLCMGAVIFACEVLRTCLLLQRAMFYHHQQHGGTGHPLQTESPAAWVVQQCGFVVAKPPCPQPIHVGLIIRPHTCSALGCA